MDGEIKWAAGLYVGEGSCTLNGKYPRITIEMVDKEALDKFKNIVGVGIVNGSYKREGRQHQFTSVYSCNRIDDLLKLIYLIYPHLTIIKQEQIDKNMNIYYDGDWWF